MDRADINEKFEEMKLYAGSLSQSLHAKSNHDEKSYSGIGSSESYGAQETLAGDDARGNEQNYGGQKTFKEGHGNLRIITGGAELNSPDNTPPSACAVTDSSDGKDGGFAHQAGEGLYTDDNVAQGGVNLDAPAQYHHHRKTSSRGERSTADLDGSRRSAGGEDGASSSSDSEAGEEQEAVRQAEETAKEAAASASSESDVEEAAEEAEEAAEKADELAQIKAKQAQAALSALSKAREAIRDAQH